ncbi:protein kinase [Paenibacillus sp. IHB B 3415]|nr:protein kinase [Paenibacillus sp. IHB B 3415]
MAVDHVFMIDDRHTGLDVNKTFKEEYRFPIEMSVSGRKFSGVDITLNKQHGKKAIMEYILKLLLKGPKQYEPLVDKVLQKFSWLDLNDSLEILLLDGVVQIVFKNLKPRKAVDWVPKIIKLDPKALELITPEKIDIDLELAEVNKLATELITSVKNPLREKVYKWIAEGAIKDESDVLIVDTNSFKKFRAIVLTVSHYIYLKEYGELIPLRHLSNQLWGQPRLLSTYKKEIILAANITTNEFDSVLLSDINRELHAPLVLISPIEELQKVINKLLEQGISHDSLILDISYHIQKVKELLKDSENKVLDVFLSDYFMFESKFFEDDSQEKKLSVLIEFKKSISIFKTEMLKIESVRHRYEMIALEEIGSGYFARVYKVFDPELNKILACKVLFPRSHFKQRYGIEADEYILRFKREVRLLTEELKHKNIVEVSKIHVEGSLFWFTMPLASFTLEKWLKDNRDASVEKRMEIFKQIISGVKYLHEREKYHRDLAPNNILLYETDRGLEVKISDFGLAKDIKSESFLTGLSKRGYGQIDFTDPQQRDNLADSTHLSDIYSLGAILYYLLSNKLPKKRFYSKVVCQDIVMKAMNTRAKRYQSVNDFERELCECMKLDK